MLTVFDGGGRVVAANDDAGVSVATGLPMANPELTGLFGAPTNSLESAMILTLPARNFTAMVAGSGGTTGVALIEATDLRNNATIPLNRAAGA